MSFLSIEFLILLSILLILMKIIHKDGPVRFLLLAAGYVFYAFFDVKSLLLLFLLSVFTWLGGRLINKKKQAGSDNEAKILCSIFVIIGQGASRYRISAHVCVERIQSSILVHILKATLHSPCRKLVKTSHFSAVQNTLNH